MEGTILSFRRSRTRIDGNHMVIGVPGTDKRDAAEKLVGKKVEFDTGKTKILGEVTSAHGNSGAVLAKFEKGMPGQSLGKKININ